MQLWLVKKVALKVVKITCLEVLKSTPVCRVWLIKTWHSFKPLRNQAQAAFICAWTDLLLDLFIIIVDVY